MITFISEAFCGSISDKEICIQSKLFDVLEPYSSIMADKGFKITQECAAHRIELIIPPGRWGQAQMIPSQVLKTKDIAQRRILVEEVIYTSFKMLSYIIRRITAKFCFTCWWYFGSLFSCYPHERTNNEVTGVLFSATPIPVTGFDLDRLWTIILHIPKKSCKDWRLRFTSYNGFVRSHTSLNTFWMANLFCLLSLYSHPFWYYTTFTKIWIIR